MLYITDKGIDVVREHSDFKDFLVIQNAICVKDDNNHLYTYLKSNNWMCLDRYFITELRMHFDFYFLQIQKIEEIDQQTYIKLAKMEISNIQEISFKSFYLEPELIPSKGIKSIK